MKASLLRVLHMNLTLLVIAMLGNGGLHIDYSGACPSSLGLTRLRRDLAETRLMRERAKIVQNVVFGTGDNHDKQRGNRGYLRA
jgi:hypothetical protein